jgi:hypothetical protein
VRQILDERDVINKWRDLFRGEINVETLGKAQSLLEGLSGESPLHLRLANEFDELKNGPKTIKKKRVDASQRQCTYQ